MKREVKPILTPWSGMTITKEWTEEVVSGSKTGNKFMITYLNKKGKEITIMKWVVWHG